MKIAILTRNRHKYLHKVLDSLLPYHNLITVFDNASNPPVTGSTYNVVNSHINKGFTGNLKDCIQMSQDADWLWLLPDDKEVAPFTVEYIANSLHSCDLLVVPEQPHKLETNRSYLPKDFFTVVHQTAPELLLCAGNVGSVVIKPKLFDMSWFYTACQQDWSYPQLPAILNKVTAVKVLPSSNIPYIRDILPRLPSPDFQYQHMPTEWHWRKCIEWINGKFDTTIDIQAESKRMNKWYKQRLKTEPLKLIWEYRNELRSPSRIITAMRRLLSCLT